ncbi:hypothetical protein LINGRAHAP2_LOCUS10538 [Linum grandiflorum]
MVAWIFDEYTILIWLFLGSRGGSCLLTPKLWSHISTKLNTTTMGIFLTQRWHTGRVMHGRAFFLLRKSSSPVSMVHW